MFSFCLHISNEQNKQEMGQLWGHMPCATERKTLKFELTRNALCQEILDLRPTACVNQFNFFAYTGKYIFPSVQYLIRPS